MNNTVKKFRKKPVVVEAMRFEYSREGIEKLQVFCGNCLGRTNKARHVGAKGEAEIKTLEDGRILKVTHIATEGDWVIKGINGEFYAFKPDIFEKTYELFIDMGNLV